MQDIRYMDLIHCSTPEEVYDRVREWTSNLTERDHIIKSTILDIHASVETRLKHVLYQSLLGLIFKGDGGAEYEGHRKKLESEIFRLSFSQVSRLLKPALDASGFEEFQDIPKINDLRNSVAHSDNLLEVRYKGRSPFTDAECLAQMFLNAWAIRQQLIKFYETMIETPRVYAKWGHDYYLGYGSPDDQNET